MDVRPISMCPCGLTTEHDGVCALCRQDDHDDWWANRPSGAPTAA
ncbi:hypothetical protein [Streptomyces sp. NPDC054865]